MPTYLIFTVFFCGLMIGSLPLLDSFGLIPWIIGIGGWLVSLSIGLIEERRCKRWE